MGPDSSRKRDLCFTTCLTFLCLRECFSAGKVQLEAGHGGTLGVTGHAQARGTRGQRRLEGRGQWCELRGLHWSSDIREGFGCWRLFPKVGMAEAEFCVQQCKGGEAWRAEVRGVGSGWDLGT